MNRPSSEPPALPLLALLTAFSGSHDCRAQAKLLCVSEPPCLPSTLVCASTIPPKHSPMGAKAPLRCLLCLQQCSPLVRCWCLDQRMAVSKLLGWVLLGTGCGWHLRLVAFRCNYQLAFTRMLCFMCLRNNCSVTSDSL